MFLSTESTASMAHLTTLSQTEVLSLFLSSGITSLNDWELGLSTLHPFTLKQMDKLNVLTVELNNTYVLS